MKKIDNLSKEAQIKKLKKDSKIRLIIMCIHVPVMISLSIYLIMLKEPAELGLGFLLSIPLSIFLGYVLPVRDNKQKILKIELLHGDK